MDYEVTLLVFGILLFLVGLVGKVKAKEIDVGTSSKTARIVIALVGLILIVVSFNPEIVKTYLPTPKEKKEEVTQNDQQKSKGEDEQTRLVKKDTQKDSDKVNDDIPIQKSQQQLNTKKLRNTIWKRICENCTNVVTYLHLRNDGVFGRNFDKPDNFEYTDENDHWKFDGGYLILEWNNGKTIGEYDLTKVKNDYHPGTISPGKKGPVRLMRVR